MLFQTAEEKPSSQETKFDLGSYLENLGKIFKSPFGGIDEFKSAFNSMEDTAVKLATSFGGTSSFSQVIRDSMAGAASSMAEIGGTMSDIEDIQRGVVKSLQTQTILNEESYKDLFASAQLVSDGTKSGAQMSGEMIKMFTNAGYGLYNIGKEMTGILNTAREIGVTSTAVYEQLSTNMSKLVLYNFENGVQGMAKMAAEAAGLRIDMKTTLGVADQLFKPEKAIEMAAGFQRLGVQVNSLLDPYKLMDMARNDPKKLQESILEASKQLTYFDEKNQRFAILPGAQTQLREIAEVMGISSDELAKMALNSSDLDKKLKEIKFPSDFAKEEDRKMIANMAQMSGGSYVVTFQDEQGETVTKRVTELSETDRKSLVEANKPALSAVDLQKEANGYLRGIYNSLAARQIALPARAAASKTVQSAIKVVKENITDRYAEDVLDNIIKVKREPRKDKTGFLSTKGAEDSIVEFTTELGKIMIDGIKKGDINKALTDMFKYAEKEIVDKAKEVKDAVKIFLINLSASTMSGIVTPILTQSSSISPTIVSPTVSQTVSPIIGGGTTTGNQTTFIPSTQQQTSNITNTPITFTYNDNSNNTVMDNSKILDLKKDEIQRIIYEAVKKIEDEQNKLKGKNQ